MIRLTGNQVRMLHRDLIVETGGTTGVRDEGFNVIKLEVRRK